MDNAMTFVVPLVVAFFGFVVFFMVAGKIGSRGNGDSPQERNPRDLPRH